MKNAGLISLNTCALAEMLVGEMMTNITCTNVYSITDTKCEAKWMLAAKLQADFSCTYEAATSMRYTMNSLRIVIVCGKHYLSMAAKCASDN